MDRLIQKNSAKEATTASPRGIGHQYESPYSEVPGSFRFPTVAPLTTARYPPDTMHASLSASKENGRMPAFIPQLSAIFDHWIKRNPNFLPIIVFWRICNMQENLFIQ